MKKENEINIWHLIGQSLLANIGAIIQTLCLIIMITFWKSLLDYTDKLPENFNVFWILLCCILLITTMRFPVTIGNWFNNSCYNR